MTLSAGSELGPWTIDRVDPEKMKTFAVVLADPNPIHLDPDAVRAAGLGDRVVNQGPASFGYVLNMLREAIPGGVIRDLNVRLTANVFGGDSVTAAGEVRSAQEADGERVLSCRVCGPCRAPQPSSFPRRERRVGPDATAGR
jgi:3-hydroxybutyryl-CoA dehydratase